MTPLKIFLISATVVSVAVTLKLTVPLIFTFAVNTLPTAWSLVITWLKPPYLYVIINGIIITIAASTRFQHNTHDENQSQPQVFNASNAPPPSDLISDLNQTSFGVVEVPPVTYETVDTQLTYETKESDVDFEPGKADGGLEVVTGNEDEFVKTTSTWQLSESVVDFPVKEKQLVTSRFARKPAKANPEGARALRVLKPKKHETLESTWKMITDGRQLPLTRHLQKSDTFNNLNHERPSEESTTPAAKKKTVKKSETFKDRTTYANQNDYPQPPVTGEKLKLKKDVSLGHDELNRRVEAFIKKFNDDMRLQRQESLKQYMEMVRVNRGTRL